MGTDFFPLTPKYWIPDSCWSLYTSLDQLPLDWILNSISIILTEGNPLLLLNYKLTN